MLERWRDRSEEKHLKKLINSGSELPGEGQEVEFRDTLAYLSSQAGQLEWEALVTKAAGQGLDEQEKRRLSELAKEKAELSTAITNMEKF